MSLPTDISMITDIEALKALHRPPLSRASDKVLDHLDRHCRDILALSPFCVLSSQGPDGQDVSPRGDPPGFIRVLDDRHLLLPDRVGNNRLDNFANLLSNPMIGLLVLVPGMDETLRINGRAQITDDDRLLADSKMQGKVPKIGLLITVKEAFLHCPKAFVRSGLWDPEKQIDRRQLASYGEMLTDQVTGLTAEESERQGIIMAKRGLY
jgi:PPOX class probable FMN-dependent enzyme